MESTRPAYLDLLSNLSQSGRATRSGVEIERMLAACSNCPNWRDSGCTLLDARAFSAMLANSHDRCPAANSANSSQCRK